jgi:endonuclease-8
MPEGHTIHRTARDHTDRFVGKKVKTSSPQGRFAEEAAQFNGCKLLSVEAHGKHLFYRWRSGYAHIHLGLYGKFRPFKRPPPEPRPTVRLRMMNTELGFDLIGPNRCELLDEAGVNAIKARLGQDPLRADADPEVVWHRVLNSKTPLGKLLLDQSIFAGVGNIYRADSLFASRVHPDRPGKEVTRKEFDTVWQFLVDVMNVGVKYDRIINADPKDIGKPRSRMNREERLLAYKRAHCFECDGSILSWDQGGRKIYACPRCQT